MKGDGASESRTRIIGRKLTVTSRRIVHRFDQSVERMGVSRAKFSVIALVSRRPGVSQRAIAERLQVTEVTAGRLVERLCADGVLERRDNPCDRRTNFIYLTSAAQPLLDTLSDLAAAEERQIFAGFAPEELDQLDAFLERISVNIGARAGTEVEVEVNPPQPASAQDETDQMHAADGSLPTI